MQLQRSYINEVERFPLLAALIAAADTCVASGSLAELTTRCQSAFDQLLNSHELRDIVVDALKRLAEGEPGHPEWLSKTAEEWIVVDTAHYSLRLVAQKPRPSQFINSLNFDCLFGNLSGPPFEVQLHHFPKGAPIDEFKVGLNAIKGKRVTLTTGQSLEVRASRDIPHVPLEMPVLSLNLYPKAYAPLIWCFDPRTLQSVMAMASHDSPIRRQTGAAMLQHIHQHEVIPVESSLHTLTALTKDPAHYVRWAALQGLCSIDIDHARPHLLMASEDPHPAIAAAARRAIAAHLI